MRTNNIIKNNLETRAYELKGEGRTLENIAQILTDESENRISLSSVYRFFDATATAKPAQIEKGELDISSFPEKSETDFRKSVESLLQPYFIARGNDNRNACAFVRFVRRHDKTLCASSSAEIEAMFFKHVEKIRG